MNINCTDRYPGLRDLVEERRLVPLYVRLAALGAALTLNDEKEAEVEVEVGEVKQSTSLHGQRTIRRERVAGPPP